MSRSRSNRSLTPVIGVCSWSLRPQSPQDLIEKLAALGVSTLQLALDPLRTGQWDLRDTVRRLDQAGVTVRSGMIAMAGEDYSTIDSIRTTGGLRPDATWEQNLAAAAASARLARELDIRLVTFHAGFLPHDPYVPLRRRMIQRLRAVADCFASAAVDVALETGQETAATLLDVLEELERTCVGVNFDPANMILYDMGDPVAALQVLAPHVRQIHIKDARRTKTPGQWGTEVLPGQGEVDWAAFFQTYRSAGLTCDLMIEREAGADPLHDIRAALALIRSHLDSSQGPGL